MRGLRAPAWIASGIMPGIVLPFLARRCRDESGSGTVFGLFGITVCLMLAGVAVDFGNAWRQRELLRLSADVAAHAGAGVLARGGTPAGAMVAATTAISLNTPEAKFGRVLYDAAEDIRPFHYDFATDRETMSGPINAVSVRLERNGRVRNAVPTFLLKLIGQGDWNLAVESVAAVVPTERCQSSEGVFAHGTVTLNGQSALGKSVCLHSQKAVDLAQAGGFAAGSGISMPDMGSCRGFCDDASSPGFRKASSSTNLVMPATAAYIQKLADSFGDPKKTSAEETAFFAAHPLAGDLSALDELDVPTEDLRTGDIVDLSATVFLRARSLPAGLVYRVTCGPEDKGVLRIGMSQDEADAAMMAPEDMSAAETDADYDTTTAAASSSAEDAASDDTPHFVVDGAVILSNCSFHFMPTAEVHGALMISTRTGTDAVLTAEDGALVGDPALSCRGDRQAVIMAQGAMAVPAGFLASNASFVIAGSVTVEGAPAGAMARHRGLAIHAGGDVSFAGGHVFDACGTGSAVLLPPLDVIKYVIPTQPLVTG